MNPVASFLLSQVILLPLVTGLVRYERLRKAYQPFLLLLMIGFVTEVFSFVLIKFYRTSNAPVHNLYVLAECILVLQQFRRWGFFKKKEKQLWLLTILALLFWVGENLILGKLVADFSPYFTLLYSFLMVMVCVRVINYFIIHENNNIFRNAVFLITLGLIIYFIYQMLYEWSFKMAVLRETDASQDVIISSFGYVNVLVNLIYTVALLRVPSQKNLI